MDRYGWWYNAAPRRQAKDGIKARSQRGAIGETWWSRRFVAVLETLTDPGRLSRGRSYARSGQVMDLQVRPGLVTARVQGSQRAPYAVKLATPVLPEPDWRRVEAAMAGQALFMAKLLAGEMPQEIEEAFTACKLSLFPASEEDLQTECSCPDWSNPCKHIAATLYILAEQFDTDPFLIFAWRGRPKPQLIERLRALRGAGPAEPIEPLEAGLDHFWRAGPEMTQLRFTPRAAEVPDAVLRQLGPAPVSLGGVNLADLLTAAYPRLARGAERMAFGEPEG